MNEKVKYRGLDISLSDLEYNGKYYRRVIYVNTHSCNYVYIDNLIGYVYLLTNDKYFLDNLEDYDIVYKDIDMKFSSFDDNLYCLCGCDKCESLYIVKHVPSKICFGVGSSCIKKFFGERIISLMNKYKHNELCTKCMAPLFFKKTKYFNKNAKSKYAICNKCDKYNNLKEEEEYMLRNGFRKCLDCDEIIKDKNKRMIRCKRCFAKYMNKQQQTCYSFIPDEED